MYNRKFNVRYISCQIAAVEAGAFRASYDTADLIRVKGKTDIRAKNKDYAVASSSSVPRGLNPVIQYAILHS